jgi:hypothetical protein
MRKIDSLEDCALITGVQTVKSFDTWENWIAQLQRWLHAIETGHKSCASFLLPHNDFGPDLIFALRRKTGTFILCSIQVSKAYRKLSPGLAPSS